MHYIDLSIKKVLPMLVIGMVLLVCVVATGNLKERRYGSTPPVASIGFAWQELTLRLWYAFEGSLWKTGQLASAAASVVLGSEVGSTGGAGPKTAQAIPVLTYHRIVGNKSDLNNVTIRNFRDQMLMLKHAGWETITLEEYKEFMEGARELPERSFLITFDDGAKESFYPVDPLFSALGYEGAIYVIANAMYTPKSTYYLSPNELQRMIKTGRWEIGSHSYDGHRPYPTNAAGKTGIFFADKLWRENDGRLETSEEFVARVQKDLSRAKSMLELEFGITVDTFAFPLGNETGIEGAANFPDGAGITESEASKLYTLGFLQTDNNGFTFNYPQNLSFIARRIHVDYDWDGARLLQELESGLPKELPLEDDFSVDRGWIAAWGALDMGRNNFSLRANSDASSAEAFLDGSVLWDNYSFNAALNWQDGSVFLLADLVNSKTYDTCVFSPGIVRIQSTRNGEPRVLAEERGPRIAYGSDVRAGIRVHGSVIECLWDFGSIVETYTRAQAGGIGIQVWDSELGAAHLQVSEILVRPFNDQEGGAD